MANVLLHIGRHKTGTTALQQAFIASREVLFAAGIDYPRHGLEYGAHHLIAEAVHLHLFRRATRRSKGSCATSAPRLIAPQTHGFSSVVRVFNAVDQMPWRDSLLVTRYG